MSDRKTTTLVPFSEEGAQRFFSILAMQFDAVESDCGDADINAEVLGMEPVADVPRLAVGARPAEVTARGERTATEEALAYFQI